MSFPHSSLTFALIDGLKCVFTHPCQSLFFLLLRLPSVRRYIFLSCSPSMYKSCQVVAMLLWAKMESLLQARSQLHNSAARCNAVLLSTAPRSFFKPVDVGGEWAPLSEISSSVYIFISQRWRTDVLNVDAAEKRKTFRDGFHSRNALICLLLAAVWRYANHILHHNKRIRDLCETAAVWP